MNNYIGEKLMSPNDLIHHLDLSSCSKRLNS